MYHQVRDGLLLRPKSGSERQEKSLFSYLGYASHTPQSVSYFFRLIVTCPIALVDSAKVGYSTLQSKAQTAGASTPQTLQGGLEEWLNCCLLKLAFSGWRQEPTTGQISGGVQTLGGSELTGNAPFKGNQPAQITGTEAEPQQIVAQRLLSCLQYPVP